VVFHDDRLWRYVEIIPKDEAAAAAVPVDNDDDHYTVVWEVAYGMSLEKIWNDYSYMARRLPRRVPVITAVSPTNPNLVYLSLEQEQRLFDVDVPQHRVVEFIDEAYDLVMPWRSPPSSRYVLAWLGQEYDEAGTYSLHPRNVHSSNRKDANI
jgi:hypothetical protein